MGYGIREITLDEVISTFVLLAIPKLKAEEDVPNVNIIFPDSAFELFEKVLVVPNREMPPNVAEALEKIKPSNNQNPNCPTIEVKDPVTFFELLKDITNAWLAQKDKYYMPEFCTYFFEKAVNRLWLRMGPSDFNNVEEFLSRQLNFLKDSTFDDYISKQKKVGDYEGYKIMASKKENPTYFETDDRIVLTLEDTEGNVHHLPSIHFSMLEEDGKQICYIFALQNEQDRLTSKVLQRKLYKLNAGIENPDVNPAAILSLKTFIDMLRENGIADIRVPKLQVLSYRFHELLSERVKKEFEWKWSPIRLELINSWEEPRKSEELKRYECDKEWYHRIVDKQDFIHQAKTEQLFKVFDRVASQFAPIELTRTLLDSDDNLNFKIKEKDMPGMSFK